MSKKHMLMAMLAASPLRGPTANWGAWDGSLNGSTVTVDTRCDGISVQMFSSAKGLLVWYSGAALVAALVSTTDTVATVHSTYTIHSGTISYPSGRPQRVAVMDTSVTTAALAVVHYIPTSTSTWCCNVLSCDLITNQIIVGPQQNYGSNPANFGSICALTSTLALLSSSATNGYWTLVRSGNSITWTNVTSNQVNDSSNHKARIDDTHALVLERNTTLGLNRLVAYAVSGSSISVASSVNLESTPTYAPNGLTLLDPNTVFAQVDSGGGVYGHAVTISGTYALNDLGGNSGEAEMAEFQGMDYQHVLAFDAYGTNILARVMTVTGGTVTQGSPVTLATSQSVQYQSSAPIDFARCAYAWQSGVAGPGKVKILKAAG